MAYLLAAVSTVAARHDRAEVVIVYGFALITVLLGSLKPPNFLNGVGERSVIRHHSFQELMRYRLYFLGGELGLPAPSRASPDAV